MLEDAKRQCNYLICALQTDPTLERPKKIDQFNLQQNIIYLFKGFIFVDEVVSYAAKRDLADVLRFFKIDTRIIGDTHASKQFTGRKYQEEKGLPVLTNLQYKISNKESKLKSTIFLAGNQF